MGHLEELCVLEGSRPWIGIFQPLILLDEWEPAEATPSHQAKSAPAPPNHCGFDSTWVFAHGQLSGLMEGSWFLRF